jgi:hypothetical protein
LEDATKRKAREFVNTFLTDVEIIFMTAAGLHSFKKMKQE